MDALEKINAEIDVFSGIIDSSSLFNEDGMLTEQGITQLGLYAQELGNARQLTAEYGNAIDALKKSWITEILPRNSMAKNWRNIPKASSRL